MRTLVSLFSHFVCPCQLFLASVVEGISEAVYYYSLPNEATPPAQHGPT